MSLTGVNTTKCIVVSGATNTDKDDEILNYLKRYGSVKTVKYVDDSQSDLYTNLIVEFSNFDALTALKPQLPYTLGAFCVKEFPDQSPGVVGGYPPIDYLRDFKLLASQTGRTFETILKEVMNQIGQHLDAEEQHAELDSVLVVDPVVSPAVNVQLGSRAAHSSTDAPSRPLPQGQIPALQRLSLDSQSLNPPDVQRVVVEHVVRTEELASTALSSLRVRSFSGKIPKPGNEADYDAWRSHMEMLLTDPNVSSLHVTRRILDSLLSPAADVVKGLCHDTPPSVYLQVLDSAFSAVQDGEELFAQFLHTLQDPGEKPSIYLQRLQLTLNTVVKRGGVQPSEMDKHLLKQFCRGCWDNPLITKLQLEQRRSNPPTFAELLLLLRTEEDRQTAKNSLMKKHMGSTKHHAHLHSQQSCACGHPDSNNLSELKEQINKLQQQMAKLLSKHQGASSKSGPSQRLKSSNSSTRPRPGFCFKCGEDGHIKPTCSNKANPALVQQKRDDLKQKQQSWDKTNAQSN